MFSLKFSTESLNILQIFLTKSASIQFFIKINVFVKIFPKIKLKYIFLMIEQ